MHERGGVPQLDIYQIIDNVYEKMTMVGYFL